MVQDEGDVSDKVEVDCRIVRNVAETSWWKRVLQAM